MMLLLMGAIGMLLLSATSSFADAPVLESVRVPENGLHPTLTWSLPAGVQPLFMEVATSPATNADGYLGGRANVSFSTLEGGQTSFTDDFSYRPGTYYAHVAGHDQKCVGGVCALVQFSNIVAFEIGVGGVPALLSVGQDAGRLTAGWSLPSGFDADYIEVATGPGVYSFGELKGAFLDENLVWADELPVDSLTYRSPSALPPGTYYVHVGFFEKLRCVNPLAPACVEEFTGILPVTIAAERGSAEQQPQQQKSTPVAADKVTSFSALKCASTQKAGDLIVQASLDENGTISAGGTLNVPNAAKVFKLKTVSVKAAAGKTVTIKVKLAKKALKAVKKALKRTKKVKASLTITARDAAGNTKIEKRAVKLKR
jgi:hypothetical protein